MTIAACYVSNEGVILGADSTATIQVPAPNGTWIPHHYSFAQKVFEFGEQSTVGLVMWGQISLTSSSYRTLIAEVAENTVVSMDALVALWASRVWIAYNSAYAPPIKMARDLAAKCSGS
jgi:hypothetical protein